MACMNIYNLYELCPIPFLYLPPPPPLILISMSQETFNLLKRMKNIQQVADSVEARVVGSILSTRQQMYITIEKVYVYIYINIM